MKGIIAKRVVIIQKTAAPMLIYSHVTELKTEKDILYIKGETDDTFYNRINVIDKHITENLHAMWVEWY